MQRDVAAVITIDAYHKFLSTREMATNYSDVPVKRAATPSPIIIDPDATIEGDSRQDDRERPSDVNIPFSVKVAPRGVDLDGPTACETAREPDPRLRGGLLAHLDGPDTQTPHQDPPAAPSAIRQGALDGHAACGTQGSGDIHRTRQIAFDNDSAVACSTHVDIS